MQRSTSNAQRSTLNQGEKAESSDAAGFEKDSNYDLELRLLRFAASVIRIAEALPQGRSGSHVAGQLLRSGTSPLPNHGEAQAAESPRDFVHKMRLCLKELRETRRWLRLVNEVPLIRDAKSVDLLIDETEQLVRIFAASIRTALKRTSGAPHAFIGEESFR